MKHDGWSAKYLFHIIYNQWKSYKNILHFAITAISANGLVFLSVKWDVGTEVEKANYGRWVTESVLPVWFN